MTRRAWMVAAIVMGVWLAGCGDDTKKLDGAISPDGQLPDQKTIVDKGKPDGPATNLPCIDIFTCTGTCPAQDTSCKNACMAKGSSKAQQTLNALFSCGTGKAQSACTKECPDPANVTWACMACIITNCTKEYATCFADFSGSYIDGFGSPCSPQNLCKRGICMTPPGSTTGFCSIVCDNPTQLCVGGPPGTMPACFYGVTTTSYVFCGFVCKVPNGQQFPCPTGLTCSTTQEPPGSGEYHCKP